MARTKTSRKRRTKPRTPRRSEPTGLPPRPFAEWAASGFDRDEDAAYAFGHQLIVHCRDEAVSRIPERATAAARAQTIEAVDTALHNVCDMLEGFWPLDIDSSHRIELALQVRVHDSSGQIVETREISPSKLDLPIGYWKWARYREFR